MRKSMKKLIALTLTCLMLATLFVGCGSKDEGGGQRCQAPVRAG